MNKMLESVYPMFVLVLLMEAWPKCLYPISIDSSFLPVGGFIFTM